MQQQNEKLNHLKAENERLTDENRRTKQECEFLRTENTMSKQENERIKPAIENEKKLKRDQEQLTKEYQ